MFSAILGLAGAGIGAFASMQAASSAAAASMYQTSVYERLGQEQADLQQLNLGLSRDAWRAQMEENEYLRMLEANNRFQANREYDWRQGEYQDYKQTIREERDRMVARQIEADRMAAEERAMAMERYIQNRELTRKEREEAMAELRNAQAIAKGERDEDMRRLYEEKAQAAAERQFAIDQYQIMDGRLQGERAYELTRRQALEGRIGQLRNRMEAAYSSLGAAPELRKFSEAELREEERRRSDLAVSDVDRAADRMASITQANLMRDGMDRSTAGELRRGEVTEQISQEYARARERARDAALAYITGAQDLYGRDFDREMARRQGIMGEIEGVYSTGIEAEMAMPGLPSAYNPNFNAPSAVYNRGVRSAMDYQSPLQINSAIYDRWDVPFGMADQMNIPSAAVQPSIGSAIYGPEQMNIPDPATYMSIASQIGTNRLNTQANVMEGANDRAGAAAASAGAAFQNLLASIGGFGDSLSSFRSRQPAPVAYNPMYSYSGGSPPAGAPGGSAVGGIGSGLLFGRFATPPALFKNPNWDRGTM